MKFDATFRETKSSFGVNLSEINENFNSAMGEVKVVHDGRNGATFYPSVSPDGVISWTNDRELENPSPVNIKGEKGDKGEQGIQGDKGEKGDKGDKGDAGTNGTNGINGKDGANGKDGYTPVKGVDYFDGKDGKNGTNGVNGKDGINGKDGYTPVKGIDYFTETDKAEIVAGVKAQLITEQWTFTLMDDTTITKEVLVE